MQNTAMEVDEEEVTIKDFPDEILLEIFDLLDKKSLLECTLVCQKWNYIIGSSAKTMKNFTLNFDSSKLEVIDPSFRSHRKHINVHCHLEKEFEKGFNLLKQFDLSQTRRISIHRYQDSLKIEKLSRILSSMKLLEDASLMLNKVDIKGKTKVKMLKLPKFKRIRLYPVTSNALKLFNPKQVVEMRIEESPVDDNIKKLLNFMKNAEKLKILRVNKSTFQAIFKEERKFSFQLTAIDMLYLRTAVSAEVGENFNKFLLTQPNIKVLNFNGIENFPDAVHRTILNRLKSLTKLTIDSNSLPTSRQFFESLQANHCIKELELQKGFSSDEAAKGILGKCPGLENLVLNFSLSNKINFIALHNPHIKSLHCERIHRMVTPNVKFENLNSLTVDRISDAEHWLSVIKSSPNIKTLTVKWVEDKITNSVIDVLLSQPSLRHLNFTGNYENMNMIFDKLKVCHGKLKTLNLSIKLRPLDRVFAKIQFDFPNDSTQWNLHREEKKFADCIWDVITKYPDSVEPAVDFNNIIKFKFETTCPVMQVNPVNMELVEL